MEPVILGYSTKNIPNAHPQQYLKCLIEKTESFLRWMRWKAYYYLNPSDHKPQIHTFGFKTTNIPPWIRELNAFEDNMLKLIQNVEFKNETNEFQKKMTQDARKIKKDEKLWIAADKTTNFYPVDPKSYDISPRNQSRNRGIISNITSKEKKIAESLNLDDRNDAFAEREFFVTLKDHKPNFTNNRRADSLIPRSPKSA